MKSVRVATHIVVVLVVGACMPASARGPVVVPRPLGRDVPVYMPPPSGNIPEQRPGDSAPTDSVALRDAIALALLHSPELAAFAWETRAREAQLLQVRRLPNPTISILAEDIGVSKLGDATQSMIQPQTTLQLSQLIELPAKRIARNRVAGLGRDLAGWDYEAARINLFTQVTQAFVEVLVAQELVSLTAQGTQIAAQVQQSVAARVTAGNVSPIEATRTDVALASARIEVDRAMQRLAVARLQLAARWGATAAQFAGAKGDLGTVSAPPSLAELTARLKESPDLARWAVEVSQRRAALSLESARRIPDVTLIAGQRTFTDLKSDAYLVGASLVLPLFDRNQGGTAEAKSRLNKAYEEQRAAESRVAVALTAAYGALSGAYREVVALRETIVPGARETFDAISEGYRLGRFSLLDVLDAQRTLNVATIQSLRAAADYHRAVGEVERLIGAPLGAPGNPGR